MSTADAPERLPRWWPIATASVLAITVVLTVLQFPFPGVRLALWRDPDALAAGQWWRLVTPLFVQYDAWWQIVVVFAILAGLGVLVERVFGPAYLLLWRDRRRHADDRRPARAGTNV
jgi:membrane associated rhomboid family serine protease